MNTEIVRGLTAATCLDPQGKLFVALFKHSRSVSGPADESARLCVHFGDYSSALRYVVLDAMLCESGRVRLADQADPTSTPTERYLLAWRVALDQPLAMPTYRVIVPASTGVDMTAIAAVLAELGLVQRKTAWLEFDLRIPGNASAMAACIDRHRDTKLQPWLCFCNDMALRSAEEDVALGPEPPPIRVPSVDDVKARMRGVAVWRLPLDLANAHERLGNESVRNRYLLVYPGHVEATGNAVSTMEAFIAGFVLPSELKQRGIAEWLIGEFREQLRRAADLPDHTLVILNRPTSGDKEQLARYERAAAALARPGATRVLTRVMEIRGTPDPQGLLEASADLIVFPELIQEAN